MIRKSSSLLFAAATVAAVTSVHAASPSVAPIEKRPEAPRTRVGISAAGLFNAKLRYSASGQSATDAGTTEAATGHRYDNGYVLVDDTGNFFNLTGYFGYDNAAQYNPSGTGSLSFQSVRPSGSGYIPQQTLDPELGPELEISHVLAGSTDEGWSLGLLGAAGYFTMDESESRAFTGVPANVLTDTYDLGGIIPPPAPYAGPFNYTPGLPLIDDRPDRSTLTDSGSLSGTRSFSADVWTVRLGPFFALDLTERLTVGVRAGLALAVVDGEVRYSENLALANGTVAKATGAASAQDTLVGYFGGVEARYDIDGRWALNVGADYLDVGSYDLPAGLRNAEMDLSQGVLARVGLSLGF